MVSHLFPLPLTGSLPLDLHVFGRARFTRLTLILPSEVAPTTVRFLKFTAGSARTPLHKLHFGALHHQLKGEQARVVAFLPVNGLQLARQVEASLEKGG